jgi:flagellar motor switch protein FliN/FliY
MEESILSFFERWAEEFARAVEMFTGERPTLVQKPLESGQLAEWEAKRNEFQWWEQETEEPQRFKAWLGAQEACWSALGGDQGEGSDPRELFQEMISQANQGAGAVLSSSFATPLRFGGLSVNAPASLASLRVAQISVNFKNAELPAMLLALDPAAARILDGPEPAKAADSHAVPQMPPPAAAISAANASMMDRLMDLQLPVSVLLGQTIMPIRDALKISSGSLIELDRQLGDYVEVVVHGTVVARGEIVAVKGNYGVRIKEVISRKDRFALKDAA